MLERNSNIRKAAGQVLHRVPLPIWRALVPKKAIGICYHVVSDTTLPHIKHYRPLTSAEFIEDIIYLRNNFAFISYEELEAGSARHAPGHFVIITFDDGFAQCADVIAPILLRYQINGVFFVITDLIDNAATFRESIASLCIDKVLSSSPERIEEIVRALNLQPRIDSLVETAHGVTKPSLEMADLGAGMDARKSPVIHWLLTATESEKGLLNEFGARLGIKVEEYVKEVRPYLTSPQIRGLRSSGFTIGAHSCSHQLLQGLTQREAEREIVESCRIIRDLTGQLTVPFAFPFFGGGISRKWLADLRRRHEFIGLFFDTDGVSNDEDFVIHRVFGERLGRERSLDGILRRAWSRPRAWRRR